MEELLKKWQREKMTPGKLKENRNPKVISEIINTTKEKMGYIMIWIMHGEEKVTAEMYIHIIRKAKNEIILKPLADSNRLVQGIIGNREEVNVFFPTDLVFFQAKVKSLDPSGELVLSVPDMIAQVDRRKSLRVTIKNSMKVEASFYKSFFSHKVNTQLFKKPCFDVGTGGLSIILSRMEMKYFNVGDRVVGIILQIDDKKIEVEGVIVNMLPIEPDAYNKLIYKGNKVCLKFENLNPVYKEILDIYVFKHFRMETAVA